MLEDVTLIFLFFLFFSCFDVVCLHKDVELILPVQIDHVVKVFVQSADRVRT